MIKALPLLSATLLFVLPTTSFAVHFGKIIAITLLLAENNLKAGRHAWYAFVFFLIVLVFSLFPLFHLWNPLVVPTMILASIVLIYPRWFEGEHWLLRGNATKASWLLTALTVPLSAAALVGWAYITKPDLTLYANMTPGTGLGIIFMAAITFSVFNALAEEIAFRGILWCALEDVGLSQAVVIFFQAIAFGILHLGGVPSGLSGMGLAIIYGLALGGIRYLSNGILMPVIVHFFADLTIFLIIMRLAGRW